MASLLLSVRGLQTGFDTEEGIFCAVDSVSFDIHRGEIVSLLGESGCGKSLTALSLLRLVPKPGRITTGEICFDGVDLCRLPEREMRSYRGRRMAIIFQEPGTALNPVMTAGLQISEVIEHHFHKTRKEAYLRVLELLARVGIPDPARCFNAYPTRVSDCFSGSVRFLSIFWILRMARIGSRGLLSIGVYKKYMDPSRLAIPNPPQHTPKGWELSTGVSDPRTYMDPLALDLKGSFLFSLHQGREAMKIGKQKTNEVARLASLALGPDEVTMFSEQLSGILTYVEQLNQLDTTHIEPMSHIIPLSHVVREDRVSPSLTVEEAIGNAPDSASPFFRVPKIIE